MTQELNIQLDDLEKEIDFTYFELEAMPDSPERATTAQILSVSHFEAQGLLLTRAYKRKLNTGQI